MYIKSVALKIQHARCVITASGNISKERRAFIFKSQSTSLLERLEPLTELARVAFQKKPNPQQQRCENLKFRIVVPQSCWPTVHLATLLACWDSGFESLRVPGRLPLVSVVSCQIVSTSG